jgi:hypothetical protein
MGVGVIVLARLCLEFFKHAVCVARLVHGGLLHRVREVEALMGVDFYQSVGEKKISVVGPKTL